MKRIFSLGVLFAVSVLVAACSVVEDEIQDYLETNTKKQLIEDSGSERFVAQNFSRLTVICEGRFTERSIECFATKMNPQPGESCTRYTVSASDDWTRFITGRVNAVKNEGPFPGNQCPVPRQMGLNSVMSALEGLDIPISGVGL